MSIVLLSLTAPGEIMRCPKCKHEQKNLLECEACGLIFEKYRKVQDRKKEEEALRVEKAKEMSASGIGRKFVQVVALVLVVAGCTYYFTAYDQQEEPNQAMLKPLPAESLEQEAVQRQTQLQAAESKRNAVPPVPTLQNAIERARNSTVSIETPWGTGSGFFVNKN